ncbi:Solute carrier family 2, facilitated glucose transporter member 2, partial [Nosema bombycis CQ1]
MNEGTLTALAENEKGSLPEVTLKTIVEKEDEERQSMIRYKFQNVEETVHTEQGTTFFAKFMKYQKVYNIFVLALSSISFGFGLSSYDIMRNVMSPENDGLQQSVFNFLSTFAISNIFLGGLIANFLVRAFPRIKRKHLLMISSAANCFAYAFQFMIPRIITVAITRIFIGIASGIVCAVVPGFLKDNAPKKLSGFIPSIHAIGSVDWYTVLVYFFVISYNIGVANVPWTLPTEIFPKNCFKTGNMIGITVNWFSGYLLAICAGVIYEAFGDYLWYFFSASMLIVSLYTGFMLKETKGITVPQFQ